MFYYDFLHLYRFVFLVVLSAIFSFLFLDKSVFAKFFFCICRSLKTVYILKSKWQYYSLKTVLVFGSNSQFGVNAVLFDFARIVLTKIVKFLLT
jgi:hypothetical protein